jgi:D-alanyl-lipoteichoic acid acyltransferase DltB (MBOAT superfamily)
MLFNTIDFIIFFVLVLTTFTVIKNRKFHHLFLLTASYFFFYYTSNYLISLLIFTTVWDFYLGNLIYKTSNPKTKKLILIISLAGNLGLLGFFKYADFAIMQFNFIGQQFDLGTQIPLLNIALPIGISFYTFHSITYTVTLYRGKMEPAKSFVEYAIFVAFFPQLVAGPILRAYQFLPQLRENITNSKTVNKLRLIVIQKSNLKLGVTIMAFGFFKKMFFADNIAPLVNDIFESPIGHESFTIILGAIAFGIQIYCDFSGYTDIAIGAALVMGFKLPINFNKPYFATSPSDFWRRWHISLSSWLRDYLYIPLGGNKKSSRRTYLNLIIVMFLGGLWHGASWNFVIWGLLHGLYLAIHKFIQNKFPWIKNSTFFKSKIGILISILVTQYLVFLAWIPFRVGKTDDMLYSIHKYLIWDLQIIQTTQIISSHKLPIALMLIFGVLHLISYKDNFHKKIAKLSLRYWTLFLILVMVLIIFLYDGDPEQFIYFKF